MKIILSRKGFDSSTGGKQSIIFKEKMMISIPIPEKGSKVFYKDLKFVGDTNYNLSEIMKKLGMNELRINKSTVNLKDYCGVRFPT